MTRATGTSTKGGTYFYYRCGNKHRTANTKCKVREIPVAAVETFVIEQLKRYALDPMAIEAAVQAANKGRDRELAKVESELEKGRGAFTAATRAVTALVDAVERDIVEAGGRAGQGLRTRLREREAAARALLAEVEDMELRRDALRQKLLDAQVVVESYRSLPRVLDAAREQGAHEEVRALLQAIIDVVEWRENTTDRTRGTATIQFFELPSGFWERTSAHKIEQHNEPLLNGGSLCCPEWLPRHDSNMRPGD